ncbi:hypothetical protein VKT23_009546 [Stygiomarasmius scandens]|uniref:Uncharacterized protein n=1 Tax=Marasmiellus scandens TaxID=2682957 RepID=A0ABR1JI73_9AGAR
MRQDTNAFMQYLYRRTELAVNDLKKKKLLSPDAASGILEGLKDIRNDMEKTSFDGLTADRSAGTGLMVARGMEVANEKGYPPSETFLEALKKVIELLGQLIRKEIGPATFDESLTQFRNTAKEKGKPVTYRYIELVRLVRDIRRPYYGRASVLVKLFRAATERLNGNGSTDLESE